MASQADNDRDCVFLLAYLFKYHFMPTDPQVNEQNCCTVLPIYFLSWLGTYIDMIDRVEACEQAGVPAEAWDYMKEVATCDTAVERISPMWGHITMRYRKPPAHELRRMNWTLNLEWKDGTVLPVMIHVNEDMLEDADKFCDAVVGHILTTRASAFLQPLHSGMSLDDLHARGTNYGGDQIFNIVMGILLEVINGNFVRKEDNAVVQFAPQVKQQVLDYVRLIQSTFSPKPRPEDQRIIDAIKRRRNQRAKAASQGASGGWE
jgi:hypothetical protein